VKVIVVPSFTAYGSYRETSGSPCPPYVYLPIWLAVLRSLLTVVWYRRIKALRESG
jgi:hypothetical protein